MKRKIDDIEGILDDIRDRLHDMAKSELIDWIMELNYYNMSNEDLIEDYQNYYGDIENES